jgi:predicted branched-subunit amino acid permease
VTADRCRFCGESLDEPDPEPRRPRRRPRQEEEIQATDFLIPTNVSGWSIAACYLGLLGFCLPVIGLVFAIPAFIFALVALSRRRKAATYGAVTSDIRAIIGLILSSLGILISAGILILALTSK